MAITLKAARANKNLSLKSAAGLLGVSVDTLSRWEKGITFPDVPAIKKIESVYGMTYNDIIFLPSNAV